MCTGGLRAADDKVLQNLKGSVTYAITGAPATPLGLNASIALSDQDIVSTGPVSLGRIVLPDSSTVMVGQQARVQISHFDFTDANNANVVIYGGKIRFQVMHPKGAQANYTFKTPVGQIGVRGSMGDISVDPQDGMRLNVYAASKPITLDTIYGEHFELHSGEKVWVRWLNGKLVGRQTVLSKAEIDRFAEFGSPNVPGLPK